MKKQVLLFCAIIITFANLKADNYAFDLTTSGINYLKTTTAPLAGNSDFTIELWFNNDGNSYVDYGRLIGFDQFVCEIGLIGQSSGTLVVYDGGWRTTTATGMDTGWHHVAVSKDFGTLNVYVDGVSVLTKPSATYNFNSRKMYIGEGKTLDTASRVYAHIDEIKVWDVARTIQEINDNKAKQLIGNEGGLVGYWGSNYDGGYDNFASVTNPLIEAGTCNLTSLAFGEFLNDYAMNFDGTDDYVNRATPFSGNPDFTLEAQFKIPTSASTSYSRIFSWYPFAFEIAVNNGTLETYKASWLTTTATGLNDGQWHHVAATRNGSLVTVYLDGIQVQQRTITALSFTGNMYIGSAAGSDLFPGEIDEVRVWNTALSENDIRMGINTITIDQLQASNLVAYYDFNRPDATVKDLKLGTDLTRNGTSGSNNKPQFTLLTSKELTPAIFTSIDGTVCETGATTLQVTAPTWATVNWYATATGGSSLGTGASFVTPVILTDTTYYAEAINGSVVSARTAVEATIVSPPNITTTVSANIITASEIGATYQWLDCNNADSPIVNATNQNYTASSNGDYKVEISLNGCIDTSECTNISSVGITEFSSFPFSIFPNPAAHQLTIITNNTTQGAVYKVYDCNGSIIMFGTIPSGNTILEIENLASGIYYLQVESQKEVFTSKFVKE